MFSYVLKFSKILRGNCPLSPVMGTKLDSNKTNLARLFSKCNFNAFLMLVELMVINRGAFSMYIWDTIGRFPGNSFRSLFTLVVLFIWNIAMHWTQVFGVTDFWNLKWLTACPALKISESFKILINWRPEKKIIHFFAYDRR